MTADAADVRARFGLAPGVTFADSANYGLPPLTTVHALQQALTGWSEGTADWREWDVAGEDCRRSFARLCSVAPTSVALLPAVSVASGLVVAGLPAGSTILVPEQEFTSVLFPALVAESRGVQVRSVPFHQLADAVDAATTLVAASWVHSASGEMLDVPALRTACDAVGARIYLDVTQGLGVVPFDAQQAGAHFVSCAAYKFLLCPRGVAFLYVAPDQVDATPPLFAGWRSADDVYGRFYGGPLTLDPGAAQFDVSLGWHAWYGARESLTTLLDVDDRASLARAPALRLAELLGLAPPAATIVSVPIGDADRLADDLRRSRLRLSLRAGRARASFHMYNTVDDAERVAGVLRRHLVA